MRSFFRSEYVALFVGPAPAYSQHIFNDISSVRPINKVQSINYGFDINREEIKQIGHEDLLVRTINITQENPTPGSNIDVNIEPVPVRFDFSYLPTCGLNEYLLNFNVVPSGEEAENSFISRHFGDKNFFIVLRNDIGKEARFLRKHEDFFGQYVIGIGNAFATNYSVATSVRKPLVASVGYIASNIKLDEYGEENFIPAINLASGKYREDHKYIFQDNGIFQGEYEEPAILSNNINLNIKPIGIGGVQTSGENANAVAFNIDISLDRRNLYGLGSMYPYDRKLNLPGRGNLNLSIIKKNLETGNLNKILFEDKTYDIQIDCFGNCIESRCKEEIGRSQLMTYVIDNAVLKSQNSTFSLNDYATVDLNFDFTLTRKNGFLVSGGCIDKSTVPGINDPAPPKIGDGFKPIILPTPTASTTNTPTVTPTFTPSRTPGLTKTPTVTPTLTVTPTTSVSPTVTPTISVSQTVTPTISVSPTVTPTISVSPTVTPTISVSQTVTPSVTRTPFLTQTPSVTVTTSATTTPTATITPSVTITPSITTTPSVTLTPTPTCVPKNLNISFDSRSTYVTEGEITGVRVYRNYHEVDNAYTGYFELNYSVDSAPDSAISGIDFSGKNGTLEFNEGEDEKVIYVETIDDILHENTEYFNITLNEPDKINSVNSNIIGQNPYRVLLLDDDYMSYGPQYVRFQYHSTYLTEGLVANIDIIRDTDLSDDRYYAPFAVSYKTEEVGSAEADIDYGHVDRRITFLTNEMIKTITITGLPVPANSDGEKAEYFQIRLYNPDRVGIVGANPYSVFLVEPS